MAIFEKKKKKKLIQKIYNDNTKEGISNVYLKRIAL